MQKYFNRDFFKGFGLAAVVAALLFARVGLTAAPKTTATKPAPKQSVALSDEQQGILAVRSAKPAVVSISGAATPATSTGSSALIFPSTEVEGTGFIIDSGGLIVSNNHVVEDPTLSYTVTLTDGTEYPAKILGLDKYDDVAILKIDASHLPVITLGDSSSLETGQTVFAIGNSLGKYQDTVTRGVVSGLGRALAEPTDDNSAAPRLQNLIQTDAAINPGNSGGPLIDMSGAVVGMDTLIDTQGSNLGFAVPVNTIKQVVTQLQNFGKVAKPYMGVEFATITPEIKAMKNLSVSNGAYISSVTAGSPADAAGLEVGDVILSINHMSLDQNNELDTVVSQYAPGTQILVTYVRNGQQTDTVLILGVLP